jgi:N-acetyl-gamma-glutamyl-phosphate/LysW-gamma-L-alpha-aminoadipyl-6-phosphate reductase
MVKVSIMGGSGYTGGELLRLLLRHPKAEVQEVASDGHADKLLYKVHPNLRKATDQKFVPRSKLRPCDILFTAVPHGTSMSLMEEYLKVGTRVVDLSADFRLRDAADYPAWYGHPHASPGLLKEAVYGLPELHRDRIKGARIVSGTGCLAVSAILGMYPLFKNRKVDLQHVIVDSKVGSSAAGAEESAGSHHPERAGVVRPYAPTMHRHTAEMEQELNFDAAGAQSSGRATRPLVSFTGHAVDLVRGIMSSCHLFLNEDLDDREIWKLYRKEYGSEPFIRIVKEPTGIHRFPEPKLLAGSNFCDIGFERDRHSSRVVVFSAIDNLMKGAAGGAVQCMNVMCGFDEREGLRDFGFHPI